MKRMIQDIRVVPINNLVWLLLRDFSLRKTKTENKFITIKSVVEKAVLEYCQAHR